MSASKPRFRCRAAGRSHVAAAFLILILSLSIHTGTSASPNPITCEGYPEPRVFIDSQSWWKADVPGASDFGHVHHGACLPERQHLSSDFDIDLRLIMHDNPGQYADFDLVTKGVGYETVVQSFQVPGFTCPVGTCERWLRFTVHMADFQESGLQEMRFRTFVDTPDGNRMHASTNWQLYVHNGRPEHNVSRFPFLRNKGWYGDNPLAGYCEAGFTTPLPMAAISGTWTPSVRLVTHSTDASFPVTQHTVTIDPDFHADPPIPGTVIKQGTGSFEGPVSIDTTQLSNGTHKLHLRSDCDAGNSTNSGVGVIFFRVQNACPDLNGTGYVDTGDLGLVTQWFGQSAPPAPVQYDLAPSGFIDAGDIGIITARFGEAC